MQTPDIHVLAAGTALPGPALDNAALAARFGLNLAWRQWVDTFIGTDTRHLSIDLETGAQRYTLADLGEQAAERALAAAGLEPEDIDLVVMGTSSPDQLMPATANVIADRLGIDGVSIYQLQSGCTGAVQSLDIAERLLSTGRHRTALVLGGDVSAKHYSVQIDVTKMDPGQMVNGVLFGDGAGACVLSAEPRPGSPVLRHVRVRAVGLGRLPGQVVDYSGMAGPRGDQPLVVEDYKAIEESVPRMAAEMLHEVLGELAWKQDEVDYLLPPQLSGRMTALIAERLALPGAEEITCVRETGNTGNALPFFQLEMLLPRLKDGQRAVGVAIESSKWIKAGFALEAV
jgi:3-oxoacyl-[acyl-carrier-protein] synthase III